jgi:3-deoxy-7-phosphoheptulonate synthase
MLVRLRKNLSATDLEAVLGACRRIGLRTRLLDDAHELLELEGSASPQLRSQLEDLAGIAQVLDAGDARELVTRAPGQTDTVVRAGQAAFGGGSVSLIAGPCAVEDAERLLEIARAVREAGATVLRGGAYKPRTSPYSFQGTRERGLEALAQAKLVTGLAVVTEVLDPRDIESVGEVADVFQVGSRNMANSALLAELGRARKPVLIKRGFAATLREFALAAEYVLAGGNAQVILCERGIRGFDPSTRNVLDVGGVAWLKRATHLPVIVDPSHACGDPELVRSLARAGLAAGADGAMCDVNPAPFEAHCDGHQAISFDEFARIASDARAIAGLDQRRLVTYRRTAEPIR